MKTYEGVEVLFHSFLAAALDGGEWSNLRSSRFNPRGKNRCYPLDRRLGGPQSNGLDTVAPCWASNPCILARSLVTILTVPLWLLYSEFVVQIYYKTFRRCVVRMALVYGSDYATRFAEIFLQITQGMERISSNFFKTITSDTSVSDMTDCGLDDRS
jgi:hypothetical protein